VITAVILAGGLGTRLRTVLPVTPKPLAPINGRPFLEYQMDYWVSQGVNSFVLSVGYLHEQIIKHFGCSYKSASIDYVVEEKPLGTGGGLILALDKIKQLESFLLLNGDTYFEVNLAAMKHFSKVKNVDWCFALFNASNVKRYMGLSLDNQSRIIQLDVQNQENCLANGGVYWVRTARLLEKSFSNQFKCGVPASLESDIFKYEMARGSRFYGFQSKGTFIDIGIPEDYAKSFNIFKE
jgi:D-glycero-alpha-D-manno-heptose 1-phosphate guanylyltransferase